jgi:hypothetical protein
VAVFATRDTANGRWDGVVNSKVVLQEKNIGIDGIDLETEKSF